MASWAGQAISVRPRRRAGRLDRGQRADLAPLGGSARCRPRAPGGHHPQRVRPRQRGRAGAGSRRGRGPRPRDRAGRRYRGSGGAARRGRADRRAAAHAAGRWSPAAPVLAQAVSARQVCRGPRRSSRSMTSSAGSPHPTAISARPSDSEPSRRTVSWWRTRPRAWPPGSRRGHGPRAAHQPPGGGAGPCAADGREPERRPPARRGSAAPRAPATEALDAVETQAALGGPARELVARRKLQLAQHGGHVGLHRLGRDVEPQGDLLVHVAAGDVLEHLAFARCQVVELRFRLWRRAREGVEHKPGEERRRRRRR